MSMPGNNEQQRAAKAEAKEQRDRDAARAMQEYQAQTVAVQARSAELRELRLAQEAAGPAVKKTVRKTAVKRSRVKR